MITAEMSQRARQLAERRDAFVTATVVRTQPPTSVHAGDVALVLGDGTIEGFVGGVCTEHSVRAYALKSLESGTPIMLRILPFDEDSVTADAEDADGMVTVQNPCLSGGAIELFLEPVLPSPRILVVGDTPIASSLLGLGGNLGFDLVGVDSDHLDSDPADLALVVAAHGRDELQTLRRGLESGVPYVGLVASPRRGTGVLAELRADGVRDELLDRIDVPAGLDIGARTPAEIALSILAKIVAVHRGREPAGHARPQQERPAVPTAVDPICGMTVAAVATTPSLVHEGTTYYFCCEGCRARFEAQHAGVAD